VGWTKGKCHNVVPFDYGASGFNWTWPHWKYATFRDEEDKTDPFLKEKWNAELGKVGGGEWLIVQGHCDGGMRLKPGRDPKGSIDEVELCKRLAPLKVKCRIVIWACLSLRFAISFGRAWEKAHKGLGYEYYGTSIPVQADQLADSVIIKIEDPFTANLKTPTDDWDKQLDTAEKIHGQFH